MRTTKTWNQVSSFRIPSFGCPWDNHFYFLNSNTGHRPQVPSVIVRSASDSNHQVVQGAGQTNTGHGFDSRADSLSQLSPLLSTTANMMKSQKYQSYLPWTACLNICWKNPIMLSAPSPPYLFIVVNFVCKKLSNACQFAIKKEYSD